MPTSQRKKQFQGFGPDMQILLFQIPAYPVLFLTVSQVLKTFLGLVTRKGEKVLVQFVRIRAEKHCCTLPLYEV